MHYSELVKIYEALANTTKRLEKTEIISQFVKKLSGQEQWIYLLRGRAFPDYDEREFGISTQLVIKSIAKAAGRPPSVITKQFRTIGDLGDIAEKNLGAKTQETLFAKKLDINLVFTNLQKLTTFEGKGSVDKKISLILELLTAATSLESKYIVRTLLNDLRVGVADATLRDAIAHAYFPDEPEAIELLETAYDCINDFAEVLKISVKGKTALKKIQIIPGRPIKVMLPVKVNNLEDAFRICGNPLAVEHKYDGFRVLINFDGKDITLFTRKLDNVTNQFPDVVASVKENVKGKSFVLDSEVVGFSEHQGKKRYEAFESISQRIRRKHNIESIMKKLPVEVKIFDILYYNGKSLIDEPFTKRRELLEKIINSTQWVLTLSKQFISDDPKKIIQFYTEALKIGEEGVMFKRLDAPYRPGRRVGYIVKMKPSSTEFDLVITGAEYGTGKRSGGLTSYILSCRAGEEGKKFLEIGKVSSGLKEKENIIGTTYTTMNTLLQPLIMHETKEGVNIKPKIVVSVIYQNIQISKKYSSGYALRFPRIIHYRPERGTHDIATIDEIKKEFLQMQKARKKGLG